MRKSHAMVDHYHWRDCVALPDDDNREFVDGRLVQREGPKRSHERIVALLIAHLVPPCQKRGLHVLASGYRVRVNEKCRAQPDIQILTDETYRANPEDGLELGRPEMIVEVISPTSRAHDRLHKLDWYAAMGVPEYWLVDPDAKSVQRLVLDQDTYLIVQGAADDDVFRPKSFRGLKIDLSGLWSAT